MARKNTTEIQHAAPDAGGSYSRDPDTGELTLVERTEHETESSDADNTIPFDNTQE